MSHDEFATGYAVAAADALDWLRRRDWPLTERVDGLAAELADNLEAYQRNGQCDSKDPS